MGDSETNTPNGTSEENTKADSSKKPTPSKDKKEKKDKVPKPLKVKKQEYKIWDVPQYTVSTSPHVKNTDSVKKVMWTVFIALLPATLWGIAHFAYGLKFDLSTFSFSVFTDSNSSLAKDGWFLTFVKNQSFRQIFWAIFTCVATEAAVNYMRKQKLTIFDGSAALTGLLLGMILPPNAPTFIAVVSSIFTISVVKHLFGGLGGNFLNPALAGRVFAMSAWTGVMYTQSYYLPNIMDYLKPDSITSATSLEVMKKYVAGKITEDPSTLDLYSLNNLAMGNIGGSIGEISAILLILGALYLFYKKYVTWEIPLTYIGTVFLISYLVGGKTEHYDLQFALYQVLSGGLILGALYMATDMVTCPLTSRGQLIFGVSLGVLTVLIRFYGGYPEGVAFSILILNLFVPLIDKVTMPRIFGHKKLKKEKA